MRPTVLQNLVGSILKTESQEQMKILTISYREAKTELIQIREVSNEWKERYEVKEVAVKRLSRENVDLKNDLKIYLKRLEELGDPVQIQRRMSMNKQTIRSLEDENLGNERLLMKFEAELQRKTDKIDEMTVLIGAKDEEIGQLRYPFQLIIQHPIFTLQIPLFYAISQTYIQTPQ